MTPRFMTAYVTAVLIFTGAVTAALLLFAGYVWAVLRIQRRKHRTTRPPAPTPTDRR